MASSWRLASISLDDAYWDAEPAWQYSAALKDRRDTGMRGVETGTNHQDSVAYWRIMMAAYGVKGYARYVP